jgi:hypothetical protein
MNCHYGAYRGVRLGAEPEAISTGPNDRYGYRDQAFKLERVASVRLAPCTR